MQPLFKRIRILALEMTGSVARLAAKINIPQTTFNGYLNEKRQHNLWPLLPKLLELYPQVSRKWLYFGEGDMLQAKQEQPVNHSAIMIASPLPIVGLAACGIQGMEQILPFAVTASPLTLGPRSIAVVASGESMVPAGIVSGHICYCDPDQTPLQGEAVFVRQKDYGALKLFLGKRKEEGKEESTRLLGWHSKEEDQAQQPFVIDLIDKHIDFIAPVILVRRRL